MWPRFEANEHFQNQFFEGKVVDGFQGVKSNSEIIEFVKKAASFNGPGQEVEDLI